MKKILPIALLFAVLILSGCTDGEPSGEHLYKGIPSAPVPDACAEYKDDACALFECMVDRCWCLEIPDAILIEGGTVVANEEQAVRVVINYIEEQKSRGGAMAGELMYTEAQRAVKLNDVFYNVFCDAEGDEVVYTVAADGTIVQTGCYV